MTRHRDAVRLQHMLEHATEAISLAAGRDRADLGSDRLLELALTRLVQIVGEAAARVSPATRIEYGELPWDEIVGLRNRLVHGYDAIDLDILWDIVQLDLPPLVTGLRRGLENCEAGACT
jgi:uncharacterized protein with HEPN domain